MRQLPVILESQDDMSVVDGATTEPRIRINRPDDENTDAGFQVSGISPKISLNSRSHLQHVQRPTSSHFCKDAPSLSRVGYEYVARGSRGRLKIFGTQNSRVLLSTM
jgi:hypothetical protein